MDIDLLAKMVKNLILDNDRVVLPGLGCFVAELVPSTFSDKGYTINPPYRRLYFRSKPDEGNELVAFYAESNNVPMALAENVIHDFIAEMKEVLFLKKTVIFPGLGRLRATKENDIFFVADEDLDIYPAGFGLEPVSLKTHQESPKEVAEAVGNLKSILEEPVREDAPVKVAESAETPEETAEKPQEAPQESVQEVPQESSQKKTQEPVDEPQAPVDQPQEPPKPVHRPAPRPGMRPAPRPGMRPAPRPGMRPRPRPVPMTDQASESTAPVETPAPVEAPAAVQTTVPVEPQTPVEPQVPAESPTPKKEKTRMNPKLKTTLWVIAGVVAAIVLFFVAFHVLATVCPEWVDSLLYSQEELEILNHRYE